MKIAIVDADLIGRKRHRFPNLACMKLSAYYKVFGQTELVMDYTRLQGNEFGKVFICKVFTDTPIPEWVQKEFHLFSRDVERTRRRIQFGGTGFYFDKAPNLPDEIEHHKPDYSLYERWVESVVLSERSKKESAGQSFNEKQFRAQFKEYTEYSIGFLTRGCFRKCPFCVNQKYSHVFRHSPLVEFLDAGRKKICLLDDNFFGFRQKYDALGVNHSQPGDPPAWKSLLAELKATGKPFKFKQGLDERLLTEEICEELFSSNYDGDYTFAFDKIKDYDQIHKVLRIIRGTKHRAKKSIRFYVLVGFHEEDPKAISRKEIAAQDIENAFRRIELLMKYRCLPYIMRYQSPSDKPWMKSPYAKIYVEMARWCNQPSFFKKKSFEEYCWACQLYYKAHGGREDVCSTWSAYKAFSAEHPHLKAYFKMKYGQRDDEPLMGEPDFAKQQRKIREQQVMGKGSQK